jgi:choline dehydrogenase-like flavoprotein
MTSVDRTPIDRADVCIVGTGVAGALVGYSLAKRGYSVVMLEAGERFDPANRLEQMELAIRPEHDRTDVWNMGGERDRYSSAGSIEYPLNQTRVKGVGGTTLHWQGMVMRFHEKDFEMESRYGLASDWPIGYADLQPYYAQAESELGVAGPDDNPFAPPRDREFPMGPFPKSYVDTLFETACDELGITMHRVPQARNSEAYDGRSSCVGYSTCTPVCPSGAKYSADIHVRKAEEEGAHVIDQVPVQRFEHDDAGERVTAAVYATPDGETHRQKAREFVLAAGGVESPRLLLLSKSEQYPDGLANSSGLVGRYFMEHPAVAVLGRLDQPTNQNPIGYFTSESHQFYDHDEPTPGSIILEFMNVGPSSPVDPALRGGDTSFESNLADVVSGDVWGDDLLDEIQDAHVENRVGISAMVEQLPRKRNQITLDASKTDDHGNPVPEISWSLGPHERRTLDKAEEIQRRILNELGATITAVYRPENSGVPPCHHMGTTRMGENPAWSVVDSRLRTHDLENLFIPSSSVFVTGAAMNPTLTIAALALKTADHLHEDLQDS